MWSLIVAAGYVNQLAYPVIVIPLTLKGLYMNENIIKAWSVLKPQLKDDRVAFVLCPSNEYRRKLEEVLREDPEFVRCVQLSRESSVVQFDRFHLRLVAHRRDSYEDTVIRTSGFHCDIAILDCELSIEQKQDLYNLARERHGELLIVEVQ